jgi:hypothetical protein
MRSDIEFDSLSDNGGAFGRRMRKPYPRVCSHDPALKGGTCTGWL